uniref:MLO-like protein n=1 Tax=Salix viminalis TaxID=40686 RepID=A0A6N2M8I5_SALVM
MFDGRGDLRGEEKVMGEETVLIRQGRSLVETPTYSVATWLKKTRRKALFVSLEKIKEGACLLFTPLIAAGNGHEPFVSLEGLEQLHRFLFVLGITHVVYSCLTVGLAMSKIYSWRKWENQINLVVDENLQAKKNKVMRRQSTFVFHHTSHPWSRSRVLIWMKHRLPTSYNFHKYMVRSMEDEFQGILGIRVLVQFWCSYSTVPLNVIITQICQETLITFHSREGSLSFFTIQMGSRFKKALVSESVRDSLHSWCKRVKERSKRDSAALSVATRSVCSLDTTIDEQDEITVASGSLSRSSSSGSVNEVCLTTPHEQEEAEEDGETLNPHQDHHQLSLRIVEYLNDTTMQPPPFTDEYDEEEESRPETLLELFRRN